MPEIWTRPMPGDPKGTSRPRRAYSDEMPCPTCDGDGTACRGPWEGKCEDCDGEGVVPESDAHREEREREEAQAAWDDETDGEEMLERALGRYCSTDAEREVLGYLIREIGVEDHERAPLAEWVRERWPEPPEVA